MRVHTITDAAEIKPGDLAFYVPGVDGIRLPVRVIGAGEPAFGKPTALVRVTARTHPTHKVGDTMTVLASAVMPRAGWQRCGGKPFYFGHVCLSWLPCAHTDPDAIPGETDYYAARAA